MPPHAASRLAPLLAALACAAPAREARRAEGPAAPGAGPAAVALAFAWPEGFQARVALEHRQQRGGDAPTGARLVYRLASEPVRGAIRVSTSETRAEGDAPDLEVNVRISEALRQVVGRDGSYLRTEGLEEAVAALEADDEEERATSRDALERIAALDWELLVGAWAGRTLQPGRPVARQLAGSFPLLPGATSSDLDMMGLPAAASQCPQISSTEPSKDSTKTTSESRCWA